MPRKKTYQRESLVARATAVFHRRGYRAASTEILVQELGVNRNSVYAEFGSKEGLFTASLARYEQDIVAQLFGPLEAPGATLDEIEALFQSFGTSAAAANGLGCLLCNTAVELAGGESEVRALVGDYVERLRRAFVSALGGAVRARQVATRLIVEAEAGFLLSSCLGIFVLVRSGAIVAARSAVDGALAQLQAMRATAIPNSLEGRVSYQ
jgi:TetR/AcrR family transcriptional repressor of nem operon